MKLKYFYITGLERVCCLVYRGRLDPTVGIFEGGC